MSRLALVIPCYNEEHRLPTEELRRFSVPGLELEIVFVNDGSGDGTLQLLQSLEQEDPKRFHVLNLAQNSGKAEAVRQGILAARSIVEHPVRQWHDVKGSKLKSGDFARALRDLWRIRRAYKMKRK